MSAKLTPAQFNTLQFIEQGGGKTGLMTIHWRNRHHQSLIRKGLLRLRTDPFKTKTDYIYGWVTAAGRKAVAGASATLRAKAEAASDRDYEKYVRELEAGGDE
ncbi:hypothetical protein [Reyranella sp.]|uniref:hypothetical protein n=1 Tax=Reyranella sp. TaxID=1929291 RepID=UPI004035F83D